MQRDKLCRACGEGEPILVIIREDGTRRGVQLRCNYCGHETPECATVDEAFEAWEKEETQEGGAEG